MEGNESRGKKKWEGETRDFRSRFISVLRHSLLSGASVAVLRYIKLIPLLNIILVAWGDLCRSRSDGRAGVLPL